MPLRDLIKEIKQLSNMGYEVYIEVDGNGKVSLICEYMTIISNEKKNDYN